MAPSGRLDAALFVALAFALAAARLGARRTARRGTRRGARGGARILAVLEHWSGRGPTARGLAWEARLGEWERWFVAEHPGWEPPARGPEEGPRWSAEAIAGFLERAAARPGDPGRGAAVFAAAQCGTCHTLGDLGAGWGPDLTGVPPPLQPEASSKTASARAMRSAVQPASTARSTLA